MSFKHKITGTQVDFAFRRTTGITPEFLRKYKIEGLILDVDNTLTTDENLSPGDGIPEWVELMKSSGIKLVIVSNNRAERVKPLAEKLGIEYVPDGKKPLRYGYDKALEIMGIDRNRAAAVGDQLFTDIWGANHSGLKAIFVQPIAPEGKEKRFILFKRKLEKPFLPKNFIDKEQHND